MLDKKVEFLDSATAHCITEDACKSEKQMNVT